MRLTTCLYKTISALSKQLEHYSAFNPSPLTLKQFMDFGRNADQTASFLFLRKELLVRLANIMQEIDLLPRELLNMSSVKLVRDWYVQSFCDIQGYENTRHEAPVLTKFTTDLKEILKRHQNVVETMAEGLLDLKTSHGVDVATEKNLQYFLDRFYINRISIRMLINQHTLLFGGSVPEDPRFVGSIDPSCDVVDVINHAYDNAKFLCDRNYLRCPGLKMEIHNAVEKALPVTVVYVPSHLYHIMFELFKNAMRAVVEYHGPDIDLPDLKVFVVKGKEDLSIKLCDRGGGVTRTLQELLFNYMYTTAPPPDMHGGQSPMAGLGYGLPLARLYTRYFQGELLLVSMEGYGSDACVYLKTLSSDASELLPVFNTSSRSMYKRGSRLSDWSHNLPYTRM